MVPASHGAVPAHRVEELARWLGPQTTTERVVCAVVEAGLELAALIEMDEYTIDLVVPLPDGLVLVYDTT